MIKTAMKSSFIKNVSLSSLSIVISQVLQLCVFLFLATLVTQSELGQYTVYLSYLAIVSSIGMLQYQLLLVHVSDDKINSTIAISFIIAIVLSLFIFSVQRYFFTDENILRLLPLHIFMSFILSISSNLLIRFEKFKYLAVLRVLPITLLLGIIVGKDYFMGDVLSVEFIVFTQIASIGTTGMLFFIYSLYLLENYHVNLQSTLMLFYEKRKFALITTPGVLINSFAYNIPTIIVSHFFGQAMAAQYFLAMKLFNIISIGSKAIYDVYHGKLAYFKRNHLNQEAYIFYEKLKKLLLILSIVVGIAFILLPPLMIPMIFQSETWNNTIYFLQILAPLSAITMYVVPRSIVFVVFEKLSDDFVNHSILLLLVIIAWGTSIVVNNIYIGILLYTVLSILRYFYISEKIKSILKEKKYE